MNFFPENFVDIISGAKHSMVPGISVEQLYAREDVQLIISAGSYFIITIFLFVLAWMAWKQLRGGTADWIGTVAKFAVVMFVYTNGVELVAEFTNRVVVRSLIDEVEAAEFSNAVKNLDLAVMTLSLDGKESSESEKFLQEDYYIFITTFLLKGMITLAVSLKILLIDLFWPVLFQLVLIGFVFAVPVSALPGGSGALKNFAMTVVEVAMWPFFYNLALSLSREGFVEGVDSFVRIVMESENVAAANEAVLSKYARILADIPLLSTVIAYLLFFILLGVLTPFLSRVVVRSDSIGSAVSILSKNIGNRLLSAAPVVGPSLGGAFYSIGKVMGGGATHNGSPYGNQVGSMNLSVDKSKVPKSLTKTVNVVGELHSTEGKDKSFDKRGG